MSSVTPSAAGTGEDADWARPISRESLSDAAYAGMREALMRGRLRPGERLRLRPTSRRFGISATPMREALLRLVSERALTLDARGTAVVPRLTAEQLVEIRDIRVLLEGEAAARAAEAAPPEGVEALAALHGRIAACHETCAFEEAVELNTRFHLELCRLAAPIIHETVESLWVRCGPILSHLYDRGVPEWDPHPHLRVIEALRSRRPEDARAAIAHDIVHGGRSLLDHVRRSAEASASDASE